MKSQSGVSAGSRSQSVLFVIQAVGVGGSVRSLATVLAHISGLKRRIVAVVPGTKAAAFIAERGLADAVVELPMPTWRHMYDRCRVAMRVTAFAWHERNRLEAVFANSLSDLNAAVLPAIVARCPLVVWVHDSSVTGGAVSRSIQRLALRRARVVAVSGVAQETLVNSGLVPRPEVRIIPNPIDPVDVCRPRKPAAGQRLRLAYIGSAERQKGFQLLPAIVRATWPYAVDWIVYAGPRHLLPDTFAELDELNVDLRDRVADISEAYASCDAVIIPSLRESFCRVAAEAMANGLPVIASDLPALQDVLGENEAGLLVRSEDVTGFAEAIRQLTETPDLVRSLGANGRRRSQRYQPEPVVKQLVALLGQ